MDDITLLVVVSLLLAVAVRVFWRAIVNLLLIVGISLVFVAVFLTVLGLENLSRTI
jgi:hypothetical protein